MLGHSHNPMQSIDYFSARITGGNIPSTLDYLKSVHEKYDAVTPFEYHFLDQQLENFYQADQRMVRLFGIATMLAVFIACLGLFGLAAFTAEQRTKEIGVRKVLGASVAQIVIIMSKEFTKLVAIAVIVAAPLAYWAVNKWLEGFAYSISIDPGTFILAGLLAMAIAWLTVSFQAIRAAIANPVNSLRYE